MCFSFLVLLTTLGPLRDVYIHNPMILCVEGITHTSNQTVLCRQQLFTVNSGSSICFLNI